MIIKQLSIFLENKAGRTSEVVQQLAQNNIDILAFNIAERSDFGVLRLIVSDVTKAVNILNASNFAVMQTDVISLNCPNTTGSLAKILDFLATNNISIEYMYAFQQGVNTNAVIRPKEIQKCLDLLKDKQL